MKTLLDRNTQEEQERELHNAMIAEKYQEILGVVEGQIEKEPVFATTQIYAPVEEKTNVTPSYSAPNTQHTPHVTEYVPSNLAATLFTTETLDRIAPQPAMTMAAPQSVVKEEVLSVTEPSYSLTPMAKAVMAIFATTVVVMLSMIGANTMTIKRKNLRLKNLEEKKQELMERNEEIQRYIQELQTEDSIIQRATDAGLLN